MLKVRKAAVVGAGVMGSQIACHLANVGIAVRLLDVVPGDLLPEETEAGLTRDDPQVRNRITRNPFHPFSTFDTVSLAGLAYGQTVLSRAVEAAGIDWHSEKAHSALYDATKTAELFCKIVNQWRDSVGPVWI